MGDYFRFRVQLARVKPPVFRQFLLSTSATFFDLHTAIQDACAWEDSHLFVFQDKKGESIAGIPDDGGFGSPDPDAKRIRLDKWFSLRGNKQCVYEYDFGDSWQHVVKLETVEQHEGKWKRRLLDGARAFPREDCGGLGGYFNCVETVTSGDDPNDILEWLDGWDPEHFDQINTKRRFDR